MGIDLEILLENSLAILPGVSQKVLTDILPDIALDLFRPFFRDTVSFFFPKMLSTIPAQITSESVPRHFPRNFQGNDFE